MLTGVPRYLRICDSGMSQRVYGFVICGLFKKFALPPLFIVLYVPWLEILQRFLVSPPFRRCTCSQWLLKKFTFLRMKSTSHKILKYKAYADQLTKCARKNKRSRSSNIKFMTFTILILLQYPRVSTVRPEKI